MKNVILSTEKLCKTFSSHGQQQHVLKNLDIEIYEGDFTIIMGASGAGKSTLLYALSGMDLPTLGGVFFNDEKISNYSNDKLAIFRRNNCGFVFQQTFLLENMSIMDNILAGGLLVNKNKGELIEKAKKILTQLGLDQSLWDKYPSQLSGGEAQRAGVARALINSPKLIFADEPTGALNSAASRAVLDKLTQINRLGQSIVLATHDVNTALRGNRILYLKDGIICGECNLGEYSGKSEERNQKLDVFLDDLRW